MDIGRLGATPRTQKIISQVMWYVSNVEDATGRKPNRVMLKAGDFHVLTEEAGIGAEHYLTYRGIPILGHEE